MSLIQNVLGDVDDFDGYAVEVQLNFGAKATGGITSSAGAFFMMGVCDMRIPLSAQINYANMPPHKYGKVDWNHNWSFAEYGAFGYSASSDRVGGWWVDVNAGRATLCSFEEHNPTDVFEAVRNAAIVLRRVPANSSPFVGTLLGSEIYVSGNYAPYVEIAVGKVSPRCAIVAPKKGYVSPYTQQALHWSYHCGDGMITANGITKPYSYVMGGKTTQASAEIRITNTETEAEETTVVAGEATQMIIPQSVLNGGKFRWSVAATSEQGLTSGHVSSDEVTTVDALSDAVIVSPKNTYVNVDEAAVFDWTHIVATGTLQNKYELQAVIDGVWTTLQEESTTETMAVIPAEKLSSKITAWRVRTANNDGVYGEYSEPAKVIVVVAPQVSAVSVSGNVRPTIAWQSADQQGYEVMVDDISTGVQYGTPKKHAWDDLLTDGQHIVKVRVVNRFGLYSKWAEAVHTASNVPFGTHPELTAVPLRSSDVRLEWAGTVGVETYIYRDGERIARIGTDTQYIDHTAHARHEYMVRVVNADGDYVDSDIVVANVYLPDAVIAAVDEWRWVPLGYSATAEPPVRTAAISPVYALNYYSGRQMPAVEMSRHKSATYSVAYAVNKQQAEQLRSMIGKIVLHKRKGETIRGLLQSVNEARAWWGVESTLQIAEVSEA